MTLKINQLNCVRGQQQLFSDLSIVLQAGEALLIEGANGSGKSSLIKLIAGLATPEQGEICWNNQPINTIAADYRKIMHFIGHNNGLKLNLTVNENIKLMTSFSGVTPTCGIDFLLQQLQLEKLHNRQAIHLSAGQKRRVALAKLWLLPKKLWILDEPLTALDHETENLLVTRMQQHLKNGGIIIASSHHPIEALANAKRLRLTTC